MKPPVKRSRNNVSVYNKTGEFIIPKGTVVEVYTNLTTHIQNLSLNATVYAYPNSTATTNLSLSSLKAVGYLNVTNSSLKLMYDSNATEIYNNTVNSSIALSDLAAYNSTLAKDVSVKNTSTKVTGDYIGILKGDKIGVKNISANLTEGKVSPVLLKGTAGAFESNINFKLELVTLR